MLPHFIIDQLDTFRKTKWTILSESQPKLSEYVMHLFQITLAEQLWQSVNTTADEAQLLRTLGEQFKQTESLLLSIAFAFPADPFVLFLCDMADWLGSQLTPPKKAIQVLFPSVETESSRPYKINLQEEHETIIPADRPPDYPNLTDVDLKIVLRTHTLDSSKDTLVPARLFTEYPLQGFDLPEIPRELKYLVRPYISPQLPLDKNETYYIDLYNANDRTLSQLIHHSPLIQAIVARKQEYIELHQNSKQERTLLRELNDLKKAFFDSYAGTNGATERNASDNLFMPLYRFFTFYDALDNAEKNNLSPRLLEQIELIRNLSGDTAIHRQGKSSVATVDTACVVIRRTQLMNAMEGQEAILAQIPSQDALGSQKAAQLERAWRAFDASKEALETALNHFSYRGQDALELTEPLLDFVGNIPAIMDLYFKVPHANPPHDWLRLIEPLTPNESQLCYSGMTEMHWRNIVCSMHDFRQIVRFLSPEQKKIILEASKPYLIGTIETASDLQLAQTCLSPHEYETLLQAFKENRFTVWIEITYKQLIDSVKVLLISNYKQQIKNTTKEAYNQSIFEQEISHKVKLQLLGEFDKIFDIHWRQLEKHGLKQIHALAVMTVQIFLKEHAWLQLRMDNSSEKTFLENLLKETLSVIPFATETPLTFDYFNENPGQEIEWTHIDSEQLRLCIDNYISAGSQFYLTTELPACNSLSKIVRQPHFNLADCLKAQLTHLDVWRFLANIYKTSLNRNIALKHLNEWNRLTLEQQQSFDFVVLNSATIEQPRWIVLHKKNDQWQVFIPAFLEENVSSLRVKGYEICIIDIRHIYFMSDTLDINLEVAWHGFLLGDLLPNLFKGKEARIELGIPLPFLLEYVFLKSLFANQETCEQAIIDAFRKRGVFRSPGLVSRDFINELTKKNSVDTLREDLDKHAIQLLISAEGELTLKLNSCNPISFIIVFSIIYHNKVSQLTLESNQIIISPNSDLLNLFACNKHLRKIDISGTDLQSKTKWFEALILLSYVAARNQFIALYAPDIFNEINLEALYERMELLLCHAIESGDSLDFTQMGTTGLSQFFSALQRYQGARLDYTFDLTGNVIEGQKKYFEQLAKLLEVHANRFAALSFYFPSKKLSRDDLNALVNLLMVVQKTHAEITFYFSDGDNATLKTIIAHLIYQKQLLCMIHIPQWDKQESLERKMHLALQNQIIANQQKSRESDLLTNTEHLSQMTSGDLLPEIAIFNKDSQLPLLWDDTEVFYPLSDKKLQKMEYQQQQNQNTNQHQSYNKDTREIRTHSKKRPPFTTEISTLTPAVLYGDYRQWSFISASHDEKSLLSLWRLVNTLHDEIHAERDGPGIFLLRDWLRNNHASSLVSVLLDFRKPTSLTSSNFFSLGQLFNQYGEIGLRCWLNLCIQIHQTLGTDAFALWKKYVLDPSEHWGEILEKTEIEAVTLSIVTLKKQPLEKQVWQLFFEAHGRSMGKQMRYSSVWFAYQAFVQQVEESRLALNTEGIKRYLEKNPTLNVIHLMQRVSEILSAVQNELYAKEIGYHLMENWDKIDWENFYHAVKAGYRYWDESFSQEDPLADLLRFSAQTLSLNFNDFKTLKRWLTRLPEKTKKNAQALRLFSLCLSLGIDRIDCLTEKEVLAGFSALAGIGQQLLEKFNDCISMTEESQSVPLRWRLQWKDCVILLNIIKHQRIKNKFFADATPAFIHACVRALDCYRATLSSEQAAIEHLTRLLEYAVDYGLNDPLVTDFPWLIDSVASNPLPTLSSPLKEQLHSIDFNRTTYWPQTEEISAECTQKTMDNWIEKGLAITHQKGASFRLLSKDEVSKAMNIFYRDLKFNSKDQNLPLYERFIRDHVAIRTYDELEALIRTLIRLDDKPHYDELGQIIGALVEHANKTPRGYYSAPQLNAWLCTFEKSRASKEQPYPVNLLSIFLDGWLLNNHLDFSNMRYSIPEEINQILLSPLSNDEKIVLINLLTDPGFSPADFYTPRRNELITALNNNRYADFSAKELRQIIMICIRRPLFMALFCSDIDDFFRINVFKLVKHPLFNEASDAIEYLIDFFLYSRYPKKIHALKILLCCLEKELNDPAFKALPLLEKNTLSNLFPDSWLDGDRPGILFLATYIETHPIPLTQLVSLLSGQSITIAEPKWRSISTLNMPPHLMRHDSETDSMQAMIDGSTQRNEPVLRPKKKATSQTITYLDSVENFVDYIGSVVNAHDLSGNSLRNYGTEPEDFFTLERILTHTKRKNGHHLQIDEITQLLTLFSYLNSYAIHNHLDSLTLEKLYDRVKNESKNLSNRSSFSYSFYTIARILACLREILLRDKGIWLNHTQMIILLYAYVHNDENLIHQIKTGQGKSLILFGRCVCLALSGWTVDVYSSKNSLAERDYQEFQTLFENLGIRVAYVQVSQESKLSDYYAEPSDEYVGAVNYMTLEFCLFLLKHVSKGNFPHWQTRERCRAIFDEFDILIKETMLFNLAEQISNNGSYNQDVWALRVIRAFYLEYYDTFQRESGKITLSNQQHLRLLCERLQRESLHAPLESTFMINYILKPQPERELYLTQFIDSLDAAMHYARDRHYISVIESQRLNNQELSVHSIKVLANKEVKENAVYSNGVHQFLEINGNMQAAEEGKSPNHLLTPLSKITYSWNVTELVKIYRHLEGVTGTPGNRKECRRYAKHGISGVMEWPTHQISRAVFLPTRYCDNEETQIAYIVEIIMANKHRPILITCEIDAEVKRLGKLVISQLKEKDSSFDFSNLILYTNDDEHTENEIVTGLGRAGKVAMSARLDRGTHITPEDAEIGLMVIRTYSALPSIEEQENGRASRNGAKGECIDIVLFSSIKARYDAYFDDSQYRIRLVEIEKEQTLKLQNKYYKDAHLGKISAKRNAISDPKKYIITRTVIQLEEEIKMSKANYSEKKKNLMTELNTIVLNYLGSMTSKTDALELGTEWEKIQTQINHLWEKRLCDATEDSQAVYLAFLDKVNAIWAIFSKKYHQDEGIILQKIVEESESEKFVLDDEDFYEAPQEWPNATKIYGDFLVFLTKWTEEKTDDINTQQITSLFSICADIYRNTTPDKAAFLFIALQRVISQDTALAISTKNLNAIITQMQSWLNKESYEIYITCVVYFFEQNAHRSLLDNLSDRLFLIMRCIIALKNLTQDDEADIYAFIDRMDDVLKENSFFLHNDGMINMLTNNPRVLQYLIFYADTQDWREFFTYYKNCNPYEKTVRMETLISYFSRELDNLEEGSNFGAIYPMIELVLFTIPIKYCTLGHLPRLDFNLFTTEASSPYDKNDKVEITRNFWRFFSQRAHEENLIEPETIRKIADYFLPYSDNIKWYKNATEALVSLPSWMPLSYIQGYLQETATYPNPMEALTTCMDNFHHAIKCIKNTEEKNRTRTAWLHQEFLKRSPEEAIIFFNTIQNANIKEVHFALFMGFCEKFPEQLDTIVEFFNTCEASPLNQEIFKAAEWHLTWSHQSEILKKLNRLHLFLKILLVEVTPNELSVFICLQLFQRWEKELIQEIEGLKQEIHLLQKTTHMGLAETAPFFGKRDDDFEHSFNAPEKCNRRFLMQLTLSKGYSFFSGSAALFRSNYTELANKLPGEPLSFHKKELHERHKMLFEPMKALMLLSREYQWITPSERKPNFGVPMSYTINLKSYISEQATRYESYAFNHLGRNGKAQHCFEELNSFLSKNMHSLKLCDFLERIAAVQETWLQDDFNLYTRCTHSGGYCRFQDILSQIFIKVARDYMHGEEEITLKQHLNGILKNKFCFSLSLLSRELPLDSQALKELCQTIKRHYEMPTNALWGTPPDELSALNTILSEQRQTIPLHLHVLLMPLDLVCTIHHEEPTNAMNAILCLDEEELQDTKITRHL